MTTGALPGRRRTCLRSQDRCQKPDAAGLRAKAAKKFKGTMNSHHQPQDFCTSEWNQEWVCDITYLWTDEGGAYP
jgi:hypothetical protein